MTISIAIAITVTPSHPGLSSLGIEHIPLLVACAIMIVAALINYWTLNVPNWLSFTGIISAWLFGLLLSEEFIELTDGGIPSVMVSMLLGGIWLIPFYVTGWLGGGCVKMQAAFGAWLGCAYPIGKAAILISETTIVGAVLTTVAALLVWFVGRLRRLDPNRTVHFPAQVTLSLGSLVVLGLSLKYMQ